MYVLFFLNGLWYFSINSYLSTSGNCTYLGDISTTTSLTIPAKYKRLGFRIGWGSEPIDKSYTEVSKDAMRFLVPLLIESYVDQYFAQVSYNSSTGVLTAQNVTSTTGVVEVFGIE